MSNLAKLQKFDLKNLDAAQITQALTEHQNTVYKAALVVVALIVGALMFNDHRVKEQALRTKISQLQHKLDVITSRQKSVKDFNDFENSLPKGISENKFINQITGYATARHVTITSLSPAESRDMGLYDVIKLSLTAAAPDYKDMVLFLRDMEKSPYALRVDSWSSTGGKDQGVGASMDINAVRIHL